LKSRERTTRRAHHRGIKTGNDSARGQRANSSQKKGPSVYGKGAEKDKPLGGVRKPLGLYKGIRLIEVHGEQLERHKSQARSCSVGSFMGGASSPPLKQRPVAHTMPSGFAAEGKIIDEFGGWGKKTSPGIAR